MHLLGARVERHENGMRYLVEHLQQELCVIAGIVRCLHLGRVQFTRLFRLQQLENSVLDGRLQEACAHRLHVQVHQGGRERSGPEESRRFFFFLYFRFV